MRLLTTALVAAFFMPATETAARLCLSHSDIAKLLEGRFSEGRVAAGVTSTGGLVEVFTTADGATWTIVVTSPEGMSCVVSAGEGWHTREPESEEPEA